ncbi:MAG: DUF2807 domain-containing protein [Pirellulaceae bacterium]|nr:DUF2807 domain-containing protein [Pirellulaceae bacterium]
MLTPKSVFPSPLHGTRRRFFSILLLSLSFTGCQHWSPGIQGNGQLGSVTREVATFKHLVIAGSLSAEILQGDQLSVTIEGDTNLLPLIGTDVSSDVLTIGSKESYSTSLGIKARIITPLLESVTLSGSGNCQVGPLQTQQFAGHVTGSGRIQASGSAEHVVATITGSGNVDLRELVAQTGEATIQGSGNVQIHAQNKFDATITGSGHVEYVGQPEINQQVTGSGSIKSL